MYALSSLKKRKKKVAANSKVKVTRLSTQAAATSFWKKTGRINHSCHMQHNPHLATIVYEQCNKDFFWRHLSYTSSFQEQQLATGLYLQKDNTDSETVLKGCIHEVFLRQTPWQSQTLKAAFTVTPMTQTCSLQVATCCS